MPESPILTPKLKTARSLDTVGATVGMRVGFREGQSDGERPDCVVGWKVGRKVVEQTPAQEGLSQIHIAAPVNEQLLQQEIQLHLLLRNTSDPREETEFGKVTPREKPEQPENASFPIEVTEEGMEREPVRPEQL